MKNLFGIMQGRLLPKYKGNYQAHPVGYWCDEFSIAKDLGFDCIEFILDYDESELNPLLNDSGIEKIKYYSKKTNILVKSVCADYFMKSPIFIEETSIKKENFKILEKLIKNSLALGITDIVIPCVDRSSLKNSKSKKKSSIKFLKEITRNIDYDINICLETDLPPEDFYDFVCSIDNPQIKINYDTGNSAFLGYDFTEELDLYGHLVTNIHIKDRKLNNGSVTLGSGDCNFKNFFRYLSKSNFEGIFILQAYRNDDALLSLKPQHDFIKHCIEKNYYEI